MHWVAWAVVANTLMALVPAVLAVAAGWLRRPAVAHVLWVLVLLKMVTPPVWDVAVLPARERAGDQPVAVRADEPIPPVAVDAGVAAEATPVVMEPVAVTMKPAGVSVVPVVAARASISPGGWLAMVWVGGSALLAGLAIYRIGKFQRVLRSTHATGAALEAEVREIAGRLGLRRVPVVRLGGAGMSPMVWFLGRRAVLLVPANVVEGLAVGQRAGILAHEMAHLKRGDHWVRLFELLATVVFWWHPLLWIGRSGLRAAEEQACDAWVVWLTHDARGYASALVETLKLAAIPLPAYASGLGRLGTIKRRLVMILETTPRKAPVRGWWMLVAAGALVLPLAPTRAQSTAAPQAAAPQRRSEKEVELAAAKAMNDVTAAAVKGLLEVAAGDDKELANQAFRSLARFGAAAIPSMAEALKDGDAKVRAVAVMAWGTINEGSRDEAKLQLLLNVLKDKDPQVRANACTAVARFIGARDIRDGRLLSKALPALIDAVADEDPEVRHQAIWSLAEFGLQAKAATAALVKALKDKNSNVQQAAVQVLGQINQTLMPTDPVERPGVPGTTGAGVMRIDPNASASPVTNSSGTLNVVIPDIVAPTKR